LAQRERIIVRVECELGMTMIKTTGLMGACLALLCASGTAFAQDVATAPKVHAVAHETLDSSMARLAVKAALQPQQQPTRQEMLSIILLMSLRQQRGNRT
jgi:hypothetical protein